ncbi:SNF2-related protein [Bifidobacterium samirii]|uniref:Type III restriction enzyme, res subunit n=1 Tax=Bifidobacterium samirii TaxID=2306974 RepID=A0A430FX02_9BIFI|nr:SNF2-related protein [Bifidobacterium samirii]RSX58809.1 Type III restriction enzyme, res subunit [Bifidobacterium samirii]
MEKLVHFVDNRRGSLGEVLRKVASDPTYRDLAVATGYWDMIGTSMLIDLIKDYRSVRILIGAEPYANRRLNLTNLYEDFPAADITEDLRELGNLPDDDVAKYRETARIVAAMIHEGRLQVRICRKPFIHAKEYVFGSYDTEGAVGIIGSSNFTGRGLSNIAVGGNAELNYLEDMESTVLYRPMNEKQQYGHLSWFDMMWDLPDVEDWTGDFQEILSSSPVGNKTYGPYDVYMNLLMRLFPDEMAEDADSPADGGADVMYSYQKRNAGILVNKLDRVGTAILADSVGLGKTVTAGGVIRHYRNAGKRNIVILPPAKLKGQWRMDLSEFFGLGEGDYELVSQQDIQAIQELRAAYRRSYPADLIVIDEAHNLRNEHSERFKTVLGLIAENPDAKVLLLTATPINNGFKDLISQLELGLGGRTQSGVIVSYENPSNREATVQSKDFFDFLRDLEGRRKAAERRGARFDWERYRQPLSQGIGHFVVRSTRQGVQEESKLLESGSSLRFPDNKFETVGYSFSDQATETVDRVIARNAPAFEGVDPFAVNLTELADETRRLVHPLDTVRQAPSRFLGNISGSRSLVDSVFRLMSLLGFPAYRSMLYQWEYREATLDDIDAMRLPDEEASALQSSMTIHNILQTLWLKRLESSLDALRLSVTRYRDRLDRFMTWLDRGYIVEMSGLAVLDDDDEDGNSSTLWQTDSSDIEQMLKDKGIPYVPADSTLLDVDGLRRDVRRDLGIVAVLIESLDRCIENGMDAKLEALCEAFEKVLADGVYGRKILVFSAYADTIRYLQKRLPSLLGGSIDRFSEKSAFLTAAATDLERTVKRFSPVSKKYKLADGEHELDYLFSTDVLSEGQNLQDAGILINYDLHWNPVRMVQRNGRVNRLGSRYDRVLIGNMAPAADLEYYLGLIAKLQGKIETIKHSIGTDQGILTEADENPIEYIQEIYSGDEERVREAVDRMDEDNDMLSWQNEHVYALREFLRQAEPSDIKRVRAMPKGKWNYLPAKASVNHTVVCLFEQKSESGTFANHRFIHVDVTGERNFASLLPPEAALSMFRTDPDDNVRRLDHARITRKDVESKAKAMAGVRGRRASVSAYRPKSMPEKIYLSLLQKQLNTGNVLAALGKVAELVQAGQRYNELMRRLKKEIPDAADPSAPPISEGLLEDWRTFIADLDLDDAGSDSKWSCRLSSMSQDL